MRLLLRSIVLLSLTLFSLPLFAAIQSREIPYEAADGTKLLGYYAWDDAVKGKRPGIVVVHEWWGLNDYARRRARELAALGYAALAIDMYGDGKHTMHATEAKAMMMSVLGDNKTAYTRGLAGIELLQKQNETDAKKMLAIGYCFGGKVVLDMARQGMNLIGVASFHGVLAPATPAEKGKVKAAILVLNGAADAFIPGTDIDNLKNEMKAADVDFTFVNYPGAKHAFTSIDADQLGRDNGMDIAYNADADAASWLKMQEFFKRLLKPHERNRKAY